MRLASCVLACLAAGAGCSDKIAPWTESSTPMPEFTGDQFGTFTPWVLPAAQARAACSLDSVGGRPADAGPVVVRRGEQVAFEGWMATATHDDPQQFRLVLDGARDYSAGVETNVERPEVVTVVRAPKLAISGFRTTMKIDAEPGNYVVLLVAEVNGRVEDCPTPAVLTVV